MITLEDACEIYTQHSQWPIKEITENDNEWAFFPATDGGCYGAYIPVVSKETGERKTGNMFDYDDLPCVEIPAEYVKDPPPQRVRDPFEDLLSPDVLEELGYWEQLEKIKCEEEGQ